MRSFETSTSRSRIVVKQCCARSRLQCSYPLPIRLMAGVSIQGQRVLDFCEQSLGHKDGSAFCYFVPLLLRIAGSRQSDRFIVTAHSILRTPTMFPNRSSIRLSTSSLLSSLGPLSYASRLKPLTCLAIRLICTRLSVENNS